MTKASTEHAMNALTQIIEENSHPTTNLSLILATVWVIQNDFAVYTSSAIVMGQYSHGERGYRYHSDLIDEVLRRSMNPEANIPFLVDGETNVDEVLEEILSEEERMEMFNKFYTNREKSVWFLDSMEAYLQFENNLLDNNRHFHRNGFFLIIYTGREPRRLANVKEIFRRLFDLYVLNVNVMFMVGNYPYLYTYFPFAKNKCHSSQPEYYDSFRGIATNSNFTLTKRLFPSKVTNMYGCDITIITWTYPPYIFVDRDEKTGALIRLHGIEGSLISLIAQLMNFHIIVKEPEQRDRGEVYPNGTATGAAKIIVDGKANITIISYMYTKLRSDFMQASYSYLTVPYILAIPQGGPLSPFQRLIKPFRFIIWSCFSSSLFFAIIFIYALRSVGRHRIMNFVYGRDNRTPASNLLNVLFGGSIHGNLPHRNFARYLLMVWLLYTFVLRTAYSGQLFLILQDGRILHSMDSIQDISEQNYTVYAFPAVETVLKKTDHHINTGTVDETNTVASLYARISDPNSNEKVSLCLLEYSIRAYNQMHPTRRVDILPQPVLTTGVVFYMPLHSYLKHATTEMILNILAAGLMKRFESSYLYESTRRSDGKGAPVQLSCHVLLGLFAVYGVFLVLSVLIFFLELCTLKSLWIKQFIDFLNF